MWHDLYRDVLTMWHDLYRGCIAFFIGSTIAQWSYMVHIKGFIFNAAFAQTTFIFKPFRQLITLSFSKFISPIQLIKKNWLLIAKYLSLSSIKQFLTSSHSNNDSLNLFSGVLAFFIMDSTRS